MKYLVYIFLLGLLSCSKGKEEKEDILLQYGNEVLTYSEVVDMIPHGLFPEDSANLFKSIIDGWIRDQVLTEFAEQRLYDIHSIDRRVKDYRNSLIVLEYLSRMRETQTPKIDGLKVREYYDRYRNELKLEQPLVKGVFLKINSDSPRKEEIKGLISSDDPQKIDKLEQEWLDRALEYNYFRDKWIDWKTLTGMIPYRFGDPIKFLSENNYFETEYEDCAYYLQISEYLEPGEEQPFEYAKSWISEVLTQGELETYENNLVSSLVEKSIKEKKLESIGYDPLKRELKKEKNRDERKE